MHPNIQFVYVCFVQSGALGKATPSSVIISVCHYPRAEDMLVKLRYLLNFTVACLTFSPTQKCQRMSENIT